MEKGQYVASRRQDETSSYVITALTRGSADTRQNVCNLATSTGLSSPQRMHRQHLERTNAPQMYPNNTSRPTDSAYLAAAQRLVTSELRGIFSESDNLTPVSDLDPWRDDISGAIRYDRPPRNSPVPFTEMATYSQVLADGRAEDLGLITVRMGRWGDETLPGPSDRALRWERELLERAEVGRNRSGSSSGVSRYRCSCRSAELTPLALGEYSSHTTRTLHFICIIPIISAYHRSF